MADINQALLEGRVADEPDVKQTNSGKTVANITIATTSKVGDNEYTNFRLRS